MYCPMWQLVQLQGLVAITEELELYGLCHTIVSKVIISKVITLH